jgi:hypothetical protein
MLSGLIGWIRRISANPIFIYCVIALVLFLTLGHYLGSHPNNYSSAEKLSQSVSQSPSQIFKHPVNAPHHILTYIIHSAGISWRSALRLSSALYLIAFSLFFYSILRSLFGKSIGTMGALIFAATPLFLVAGRDGSAAIMLYSILAVMAIYAWAVKPESNSWGLFVLIITGALVVYIPGLLLWLVAGLVICRKKLAALFEGSEPPMVGAAILIALLLLVPLAAALIKDWTIIKQLVLIPVHFENPVRILKNIVWMTVALFVKTPHHSQFLIGRLPIFNIISDALIIFGSFALWRAARLKLIVLAATVAMAVILAAINDNIVLLALGVPAISVVVTAGLRYLYIEWRSIFPRNPLAKNLALSLMGLIVLVQLLFGFRYAFMAWPATTDTHNTYVLK